MKTTFNQINKKLKKRIQSLDFEENELCVDLMESIDLAITNLPDEELFSSKELKFIYYKDGNSLYRSSGVYSEEKDELIRFGDTQDKEICFDVNNSISKLNVFFIFVKLNRRLKIYNIYYDKNSNCPESIVIAFKVF